MNNLIIYSIVTPSDIASLRTTIQSLTSLRCRDDIQPIIFIVFNGVSESVLAETTHSYPFNTDHVNIFIASKSHVLPLPAAISCFKDYVKRISFALILRVDPGDTLDSDFVQYLPENDIQIAIPSYHLFNHNNTLLSILNAHNVMHVSENHFLSEFHGAGTIFSRSIFLETPDFPTLLTAQDGYWYWLNNLTASFIFSSECVYNYIKSDQSLSSNTSRLLSNRLIALKSSLSNFLKASQPLKLLFITVIPSPDSVESKVFKRKLPEIFFSHSPLYHLTQDLFRISISNVAILNSDNFGFDKDNPYEVDFPSILCSFSDNPLPQIFLNHLSCDFDYFVYFNLRYPFSTYAELMVLLLQQYSLQADCSVALKKREHLSSFGYSGISISSMRQLRLSEIQSKRQSGIISVKPKSLIDSSTLLSPRVSLSIGSNEGTIRIDDHATWETLVSSFK
ncbi:hypothetical protein N9A81_00720 [Synechococcus sp. AH-707-M23]|nr:hypothetical protein [Synechococcus sp. AH-707-M23]